MVKSIAPAPVESFGRTPDGQCASIHTLHNSHLRVRITDYGGRVVSIQAPDKSGRPGEFFGASMMPQPTRRLEAHSGRCWAAMPIASRTAGRMKRARSEPSRFRCDGARGSERAARRYPARRSGRGGILAERRRLTEPSSAASK